MYTEQYTPYYNISRCGWWRCSELVAPSERRCWQHRGAGAVLTLFNYVNVAVLLPWLLYNLVSLLLARLGVWPFA